MLSRKRDDVSKLFKFSGLKRKKPTGALSAILAFRLHDIERGYDSFNDFMITSGASQKTLYDLRTGTGNTNIKKLEDLSRCLNVSMANLLGIDDALIQKVLKRNGFSGRQKYTWMSKLTANYLNELESQCQSENKFMGLFPGIGVGTLLALKQETGTPGLAIFDRLATSLGVSVWTIFRMKDSEARASLAQFGIDFDDVQLFVKQMNGHRISMLDFLKRFPEAWMGRDNE